MVLLHSFCLLPFSICTHKQCLQRNTFTGADWLFPYSKWHGTLKIPHMKNGLIRHRVKCIGSGNSSYYIIHLNCHFLFHQRGKCHASFVMHQQFDIVSCRHQNDWGVIKPHNVKAANVMSYPNKTLSFWEILGCSCLIYHTNSITGLFFLIYSIIIGTLEFETERYKEVQRKHLGKSVRMSSALCSPSPIHAIYKARVVMPLLSSIKT